MSPKEKRLEAITAVFDDLFRGWEIYEAHFNLSWPLRHTSEDLACIMGDSERTLSSPLIDFDVKAACDFIQKRALVVPSERFKPLCAVVKGQGGGKTRQLVEISDYFLKNFPSVVALPITFNGRWDILDQTFINTFVDSRILVLMECVVRMVAVFYGKEFSRDLFQVFDDDRFRDSIRGFSASEILRGCCNHIMKIAKTVKPDANTFVLMIDESLMLSNRTFPGVLDPYEVIRSAILGDSITEALHLTLVLSALTIAPTGMTDFGRPIETYPGYNFLDPWRVATEWFKISNPNQATLYWIGAFCGSPRGLQLLYEYYLSLPPGKRDIDNTNF